MCAIVEMPNSTTIQSLGDLRRRFLVTNEDTFVDATDTECLCGVEIEAVLDRARVHWEHTDWGYRVFASHVC